LSFFVDYINNSIVKPYTERYLRTDPRTVEAEIILAKWLREQACEQTLSPVVALYIQNDLI